MYVRSPDSRPIRAGCDAGSLAMFIKSILRGFQKTVQRSGCWARRYYRIVLWAAVCIAVVGGIILSRPIDKGYYTVIPSSGQMLDRSGRVLYSFLNKDENWCFPVALEAISPRLIEATIATEDQRFYSHPGVDPLAVVRAAWQNVTNQRIVSGASGLAMQVVKLAHRRHGEPCGKAFQAVEAIRLTRQMSRDDILRIYLNAAPYGRNLVGCEAAARFYYGKPAKELTLQEAAFLAGLPKAPSRYSPFSNYKVARARRNYVLGRMFEEGFISAKERDAARGEPLGVNAHAFPKFSPHFAMELSKQLQQGKQIVTTIDKSIQIEVEKRLSVAVRRLGREVDNAAAIVVDVETAEILARAGSAEFFGVPGGQYDACQANRSPGSTLKPFVYALAMEKSLLYADEKLLDDTWDHGLYNPENFDLQHYGLVSASYALKKSLNIPAVIVLQRVGVERFVSFLKNAGLTTLVRSPDEYGLGLTLGDCEVKLEELAAAYCMLANLGIYRPLALRPQETVPEKKVLSRGICVKLYEMLEQPLPTELDRVGIQPVNTDPRVCWKTGTSWGLRDAWTFVFNRHYVVGVWLGNNDGRSSGALVGAQTALPLAARIFRDLPKKTSPAWPEIDGAYKKVRLCATSGLPASRWCKHTQESFLPRCQYVHRVCDVHHPAPANDLSGETNPAILERWPGSTRNWDLAMIRSPIVPTARKTESQSVARGNDLSILTPPENAEYILTGEENGDRVRLRSTVDSETVLHWYLDDLYAGSSRPQEPLYLDLKHGSHCLTCMTGGGETDSVRFTVYTPREVAALNE